MYGKMGERVVYVMGGTCLSKLRYAFLNKGIVLCDYALEMADLLDSAERIQAIKHKIILSEQEIVELITSFAKMKPIRCREGNALSRRPFYSKISKPQNAGNNFKRSEIRTSGKLARSRC